MSYLYPVKVYDGEGNLIRVINTDELKDKANHDLKNSGYVARQKQQKHIAMAKREAMKEKRTDRRKWRLKEMEKENINLNADGMQGEEQCNDAHSDSAEESILPIGRLKDTLGESERE
tara:strand:+ start:257 stop:610 length:354 start_codon:yes stop_codon:yes gene_type:complete